MDVLKKVRGCQRTIYLYIFIYRFLDRLIHEGEIEEFALNFINEDKEVFSVDDALAGEGAGAQQLLHRPPGLLAALRGEVVDVPEPVLPEGEARPLRHGRPPPPEARRS